MMQWFKPFSTMRVRAWLGRHLLFWLVVCMVIRAINGSQIPQWVESLQTLLLMMPYNMVLVYTALYWVVPPVLTKQDRRFGTRVLIYLTGGWVFTFFYRAYVLIPFRTGKTALFPTYHEIFALGAWIVGLMIVVVAVSIKLYQFWYQREQANQQLTRETLLIELQVLKAQIHPHFLFNTLNNLYALTLSQSTQAPAMVLKLSGLLQYMMHECSTPAVPLKKEIDFLQNYIDLEKLRYGSRLLLSITSHGEIDNQFIAPLLLIPFVENAFKHGSAQQIGPAHIKLSLDVTNNVLTFRLENSKDEHLPRIGRGLGLLNVQKRLKILYPNAHALSIRPENRRFIVEMSIDMKYQQNKPSRLTLLSIHQ